MMRGYVIGLIVVSLLGWSVLRHGHYYPSLLQVPNCIGFSFLQNQVARLNAGNSITYRQVQADESLRNYLLFDETFEGIDPFGSAINLQTNTEHGIRVVSDPVNKNNKAARFELRASDPMIHRGKRSELFVVDRIAAKEMWYSFAVLFPKDGYAPDSSNELISQWHQEGSPPISLRTVDNVIYLRVRHDSNADKWKIMEVAPLTKDVWHEFVFHIIHSAGSDALLEVWHNNQKCVTYNGPNHFEDKKMPYWKVGVYKAKWNKSRTVSDTRVIYFDNIRVGNELASYETMQPSWKKIYRANEK
ncbi:polysaccharide lyase [Pontibacter sp. HSC-14F20]|uniref:polysaccharide lyase n=1 Tax=Pontibacter sp. HSC-14F20 TaxID=2864136 RepID=UPI001C72FDF6|nr:polysaccharide lyase [Pontibacter sp. HSC-14F20]MBX0332362.1 polysaccharide lyase [Pontibacter sp. HSC-14F20]